MKISVSTIGKEEKREIVCFIHGKGSDIDPTLLEFNTDNSFPIGGDNYTVKAAFSTDNSKGNLSISRNDEPLVNTLVTVDGTFVLMYKMPHGFWLEIIVSE